MRDSSSRLQCNLPAASKSHARSEDLFFGEEARMVAVCSSGKYFTGPGRPFLLWLALLPKSHAGIVGKGRASPSKSTQESRQKSPRVKRLIVQTVALMFWFM